MPNISNIPSNCIFLHWVRASAHSPIAYPFAVQVLDLRLAEAVEQLLGNSLTTSTREFLKALVLQLPHGSCELHFPFVGRKEMPMVETILTSSKIQCDAPGVYRLVRQDQDFEDEFYRQCVTVMAGSQFDSGDRPSSLSFSHSAQAVASAYLPWFPELADSIGPAKISISLTLVEQAWRNTLPERNRNFLTLYSSLSVAMRRAMRFWVPFIFFTDGDRYSDASLAWPMLAWAASFAPQAKNIREFSYDILDPQSMEKAGKSYRRGLGSYLKKLSPAVASLATPRLIARYAPDNASEGARQAEYNRDNLYALFSVEADLVDLAQRVSLDLAKLRACEGLSQTRQLAQFQHIVRSFSHDFLVRLRRLYASKNWENLATLLLIEMTNTLRREPQQLFAAFETSRTGSLTEKEPEMLTA